METIQVSDKYRVVITKDIRKAVPLKVGQEVMEIPLGDAILIVPLTTKPDVVLKKYLRNIRFSRKARKKAEEIMVKEATPS